MAIFDRNGAWLGSFGDHGTWPGQFNNVHDIAVSRTGEVSVADRANRRIQVFSPEGRSLRVISIDVAPPNTMQTLISLTEDGSAPRTVIPLYRDRLGRSASRLTRRSGRLTRSRGASIA